MSTVEGIRPGAARRCDSRHHHRHRTVVGRPRALFISIHAAGVLPRFLFPCSTPWCGGGQDAELCIIGRAMSYAFESNAQARESSRPKSVSPPWSEATSGSPSESAMDVRA
jgi:hypothetical protein|eukprot:SAG25_NODE_865_length_5016_cov_52.478137_4_plen_111_part_00